MQHSCNIFTVCNIAATLPATRCILQHTCNTCWKSLQHELSATLSATLPATRFLSATHGTFYKNTISWVHPRNRDFVKRPLVGSCGSQRQSRTLSLSESRSRKCHPATGVANPQKKVRISLPWRKDVDAHHKMLHTNSNFTSCSLTPVLFFSHDKFFLTRFI